MDELTIQEQLDQIITELKDARKSHQGTKYGKVGPYLRTLGSLTSKLSRSIDSIDNRVELTELDINYLRENINELIDVDTVDGLEYKNNTLFLTKKGEKILPGVKIVSGTGTGTVGPTPSSMNVKIEMLNDSNTFNISSNQSALLKFKFLSEENGELTGKCNCIIYRNTVVKNVSSIKNNEIESIDVKDYLTVGVNNITVECSDIYGNKKYLEYVINVVSLEITSSFNDSKFITDDTFNFNYNQSGEADKKVHFLLGSGTLFSHTIQEVPSDGDRQQIQVLDSLPHGAYPLEVYMTANVGGNEIESNHLYYEVIFKDINNNRPIISSCYTNTEIVQGDLISIPFIVYDPESPQCEVTLRISYNKNGEEITSNTTRVVSSVKEYWNVRNVPVGNVTFSVIYNKLGIEYKKSHTIKVEENDISIRPATTGLELFLSAEGRSNSEENLDKWEYNGITTTFTNFNWGTNGWLSDNNGDTCLRLNGDARISIDLTPFKNDFKSSGKTFEFEFAITNVNNRNAVVIDCFDEDGNKVGIQATADEMFFNSNNDRVFCNYTENQRIRVGFTVQPISEKRFMCVYLNGVLSGIKRYEEGDSFAQTNAKCITIGSSDCGIDMYAIRIYDVCLNDKEMTNNYIADVPNIIDRMDIYGDNDLYEKGKISYKKVKQKIPTVTFIGKMPTYKGDKKKKSVRMIFEHPTKPELNFDEILDQIDVQGTSSAGYVRKNWKTKHSKEHAHMEGELPAKVFCLKVDYAEATGTHNTQNANLIEAFYDKYPIPPLNVPEDTDLSGRKLSTLEDINKVRTTIAGFPICIFHLDTSDPVLIRSATIATLESGEYDVVFSSKGNFNYDKGAEDVFAFNENYDVECWEFKKNEDPQSFLTPWPELPLDYWEARYHPLQGTIEDKLEAIEDLDDEIKAVEYKKINEYAENNNMFLRFKEMYEWVHSTARGVYNQTPERVLPETYTDASGTQYLYDTDAYRLAKFKDEFEKYFDLDYCAIYYVYTFFALMVDQRAKNMFLTYWRNKPYEPSDPDHTYASKEDLESNPDWNPGKWYPYFYDNDTCFGISNKGHLDFDYYHQDTDSINGSNVYNGANSVLWCNFRDAFAAKIASTYSELRSDNKISYNKIIDQFINQGSDMWSASIYNADADYKYISVSEDKVDGVVTEYPYLFQVRGNGEQHLEYIVNNRIKFCDSKWKCGEFPNDTAMIQVYNPTATSANLGDSIAVRPPNMKLNITPFSKMYYSVHFGKPTGSFKDGLISKLAENTTDVLTFENETINTSANDFETYIYGASQVSSLGDLSYLYPKQVLISNCVKLTELTIGCSKEGPNGESYCNPNLTTVVTGNNTLLSNIDVSNCPNLKGALNLSGCINIKKVYAKGSGITSLSLPNGGYINELVLPNTFNNLILKGQKYLDNSGIKLDDFKSLNQLNIDNCPKINTLELLENCKDSGGNYTVKFLRLTNVNLGDVTYDYLMNKLAKIGGIDEYNSTYVADENRAAYIEGTCNIDVIDGEQLANIKRIFPYLTVYYKTLNLKVTFKNEDGSTQLGETLNLSFENGNSTKGVTIECPVVSGIIDMPEKSSTDQYHYEFGGWSKSPNSNPDETALMGISADTTLYVAFNSILRQYPVTFYVEDNDPIIVDTYYGHTAVYPHGTPQMPNVSNPGIYKFIGWVPSNVNITAPTPCYAQFTINEQSDSIGNYEITEFDYTLNDTDKTITLNKANVIENTGRILDKYNVGSEYTVTGINGINVVQNGYDKWIGCFSEITEATYDNVISGSNIVTPGITHRIEYVVLPETLTTIGQEAFLKCENLVAINIPKNVSNINYTAFDRCISLDSITVDKENNTYESIDNCLINKKTNTLITGGNNCVVPDGVTTIGSHAFWGRHNLKSIKIPSTVTTLDSGCFCECFALDKIDIPNSVTTFNSMCLYKSGVKEIIFPENTTKIGMYATKDCSNLKRIVIKQKDPSKIMIDKDAFGDGTGLTIYVPWSKGASNSEDIKWGAVNATIVNDYSGD